MAKLPEEWAHGGTTNAPVHWALRLTRRYSLWFVFEYDAKGEYVEGGGMTQFGVDYLSAKSYFDRRRAELMAQEALGLF